MDKRVSQRRYYEAQSSGDWDRQKIEFEMKVEELRQAKNELAGQKLAMLSPKRSGLVQSKTFEEMQALLVLKEEENAALSGLLGGEREKNKNLMNDLMKMRTQNFELDSKLKSCQGQLSDVEKSIGGYFNSMTMLKTNVSKWLGSPTSASSKSISGFSSPKYIHHSFQNPEISSLKQQLSALQSSYENTLKQLSKHQEKEPDNLLNYLTTPRASTHANPQPSSLQSELDQKTKAFHQLQEEFQQSEHQYQQKLSELSKENSRHKSLILDLETKLKSESRAKNSHSYSNSKNFEDYEKNLKILTENNQLLQDKIKVLEADKLKIIQDFKAERKFTATELAKLVVISYSTKDEQKAAIEENLCKLWLANESVFSDMLHTMFGKDFNGLFKTMQGKLDRLQRESVELKKRLSVELSGKSELGAANKRLSFKDDVKQKKFSSSMSQESLKQLFRRGSPGIPLGKVPLDDGSASVLVLENMITEISESERNSKITKNFVLPTDLVSFLQCSASALEDCLGG